ncbi:MAG: hypothetical protein AAF942_04030 [Pseudomonadota bacterium]
MKNYEGLGEVVVAYPEKDEVLRLSKPMVWDFTKYCLSVKPPNGFASAEFFTPDILQPWMDYVMIVDYISDVDEFRYRHYGPAVAKVSGFDMTGRYVSDFDSEVGRFFERLYRMCITDKVIIHSEHSRVHAVQNCDWHRVMCPVRDGGRIFVVTLNLPIPAEN